MPPARIGMLIDSLARGGAERLAVELAGALDRDRFAPFFVVTRHGGALEDLLHEAGIPVAILGRRGKYPPLRTLARARRILGGADLIHAHLFSSSMWGALLARSLRVPLVTRDPTWDGVRTPSRTYGYRYLVGPTARFIVCPSDRVARSIEDEGVPADKLVVITNGVRRGDALTRDAARTALGLPDRGWVIGIIATLRIEKAHETLFRAFARVVADGREATLCVVGDGPRRAALEALAGELDIGSRLVWAGDRDEARRLAPAFDTAVICSAWEGLPFSALEVMAAGVPLVATRVGALPEILADGAGIVVEPGDDGALAVELAGLIGDPARARAIGARGAAVIDERYRFEDMVGHFVDLYEKALARRD